MQAHLLRTQQLIFLVLDIFFRFGFEKKSTSQRKRLFDSIISQ